MTEKKYAAVEVKKMTVRKIVAKMADVLKPMGITRLPLSKARMSFEISGVVTAYANALRRTMIDEMKGRCLVVGKSSNLSGTTDVHMIPQFVRDRIMNIPLRPQIPKDVIKNVKFQIDMDNKTTSVITVFSGDMRVVKGEMTEPIFNPTFEIAVIQPGTSLHVEDITISEGFGRGFGTYQVGCMGVTRPLDIPEYSHDETHKIGAEHGDESGYKISTMVADPRHHEISIVIPAVGDNPAEVTSVAIDACINIRDRLRAVQKGFESSRETSLEKREGGIQFTLVQLEAGQEQGILWISGETHTIGNLLARVIYEMVPAIAYVGYQNASHMNGVQLTVKHFERVREIISGAIKKCTDTMETIQKGIEGAKINPK